MISAIADPLSRIRARYRRSPVPAFLAWWRGELLRQLPERWRLFVDPPQPRLSLFQVDDALVLHRILGSQVTELARASTADERSALWARANAEDLPLCHVLPAQQALVRELSLPAAVESTLPQVLAFEMDRQTPFRADQVFFDWQVLGTESGGRQIRVRLALSPRERIEALLEQVRGQQGALAAIDVARPEGGSHGLNLLPAARRLSPPAAPRQAAWALAALALVLLFAVMNQSLDNKRTAIVALEERIESLRADARESARLAQEIEGARQASTFLSRKRYERPTLLELVNELTELLPDDIWIERMLIMQDEIQLSGRAPDSSRLIAMLSAAELLSNPQMRGAVQPDPNTGKESFNIAATIRLRASGTEGAPRANPAP